MKCYRCGKQTDPSWQFCRYCGAPLKKTKQSSHNLSRNGLLFFAVVLLAGAGVLFISWLRRTPAPPYLEPESAPQAELIYASPKARSGSDQEGFVQLSEQSIPFSNGDIVYRPESTHLVYDSEAAEDYYDNLLLVYLLRDLTVKEKEALAKKVDGKFVGNISGAVNAIQIQVNPTTLAKLNSYCDRLMDTDNVLYASYEFPIPIESNEIEDLNPWGEEFSYFDDRNSGVPNGNDWWAEAIDAYKGWKYVDLHPADISDITVGIVDSGFSLSHEDLANKVSMLQGFEHNSESDHGTHVAGIIGAWNNDKGIRGVADRARLLLADFSLFYAGQPETDYGELEWIYNHNENNQIFNGAYIEITKSMIESGAKVINNSWGWYLRRDNSVAYTNWYDAFARRTSADSILMMLELALNGYQDFLVVAAAGNGYNNSGPGYEAAKSGFYCSVNQHSYDQLPQQTRQKMQDLGFSYDYFKDHILIVGAVKDESVYRSFAMTDFSNYGSAVDICAPGEQVFSTLSLIDEPEKNENNGKLYGNMTGTSMAAPMVSGAAALVWSVNPDLSAAQVKEILISCQRDGAVGVGEDAGHTYPMLNVGMAVKEAAALKTYGYCGGEGDGTNLTWCYREDGTLTISGQGKMADWYYKEDEESPWYPQREEIKTLTIENGVTSVGKYAFNGCRHITKVEMADSVVYVEESAFSACNDLAEIKLSEALRTIGYNAFSSCFSLPKLDIPNTVKEIGSHAFSGCKNLTNVTLPIGIQRIGSQIFYGCESLTSMVIPHSINELSGTFMYCAGLKQLYLPESFSMLGYEALYKCDSLTDIYFEGSAEKWQKVEISSDNNKILEHVIIHFGVQIEDYYRIVEAEQEPEPQSLADLDVPHKPGGDAFSNPLQAYIAPLEEIVNQWDLPEKGSGMLYDIDGDGFEELIVMYDLHNEHANDTRYSVFDVEDGILIPRIQNELVVHQIVGGKGRVGIVKYDGCPMFLVSRHDLAANVNDYEETHLYSLNDLNEEICLTKKGVWSKETNHMGSPSYYEYTINGSSCNDVEYSKIINAIEYQDVLFTSKDTFFDKLYKPTDKEKSIADLLQYLYTLK